ncbi:Type II transport protein GspH [compost metagenome]
MCIPAYPRTSCCVDMPDLRLVIVEILGKRAVIHQRCNAFSLIELLAAVTLVATLAALLAPAFTGLVQRSRADTDMHNLARALNYAHLEALGRGQGVQVLPSDSTQGWVGELDVEAADTVLLRKVPAMSHGAKVIAPGLGAIVFNSLGGLAQADKAVITYELGSVTRSLAVCLNGRVVQGNAC